MKTLPVNPALPSQGLSTQQQTIHALAEKDQWLSTLTAGQILKGRILRQYSEGRYGVSFAGQERIVDSSIPLSARDILTGKVIGVSERSVSLQIVHDKKNPSAESSSETARQFQSELTPALSSVMEKFGIAINPSHQKIIQRVAANSGQPEIAIRVGLYLVKLGIPISEDLVRSLAKRLLESSVVSDHTIDQAIPELEIKYSDADNNEQAFVVKALGEYFAKYHQIRNGDLTVNSDFLNQTKVSNATAYDLFKEVARDTSFDSNNQQSGYSDAQFQAYFSKILNIQTESSVKHRFQTLPIIINGRVREFDLSLFDYSPEDESGITLRSRYLKFSLSTEFGTVALDVNIVNNRVSLQLASEVEWVAREFEQYQTELSQALFSAGWMLDVAQYKSEISLVSSGVSVIDHVLAQDSLQRSL